MEKDNIANELIMDDTVLSQIPYIGCINLFERSDRFEHIKKEFSEAGLLDNVKFYRTHKHPKSGMIGCFESHIEVYNKALDHAAEYALIFEDDIQFTDKKNVFPVLKKALRFIKHSTQKWDIIKMHNTVIVDIKSEIEPGLYQLGCFYNTRAYFIHNSAMKKMVEFHHTLNEVRDHIDDIYLKFFPDTSYWIYPSLTRDIISKSDNSDWYTWDRCKNDMKGLGVIDKISGTYIYLRVKARQYSQNNRILNFLLNEYPTQKVLRNFKRNA